MINDIPNAFMKTPVHQDEGYERIIMNIWGSVVYILCEISSEIYEPYVRFDMKNGDKIIYVSMFKAL